VSQDKLNAVLEKEKAKWLAKDYDEWRRLIPDAREKPICYSIVYEGRELYVEVNLLEADDACVHPCVSLSDSVPVRRILGLIDFHEGLNTDWFVYKDGRVDA
jgi:hypothetical protein